MSDTPLTEAALSRSGGLLDMTNHARELELETAKLRETLTNLIANPADRDLWIAAALVLKS